MDAYGYVETLGLVTAIEVADTALKTADVTLTNCYYVKGGIVTIELVGDVSAVTVAVEAATESAKRLGNFLSSNVIARIDSETKKILIDERKSNSNVSSINLNNVKNYEKNTTKEVEINEIIEKKELIFEENKVDEVVNSDEKNFDEQFKDEREEDLEEKKEEIDSNKIIKNKKEVVTKNNEIESSVKGKNIQKNKNKLEKKDDEIKKIKKQYQDMKVVELKMRLNNLKLGYSWNQIKTMPKKKLIEILMKNNHNN